MPKTDYVAVVEAAYAFGVDEHTWLDGLARAAFPLLDRGGGLAVQTFQPKTARPLDEVVLGGNAHLPTLLHHLRANPSPEIDQLFSLLESGVLTLGGLVAAYPASFRDWKQAERATGVRDVLAVICRAGDQAIALFTPSSSTIAPPHPRVARAWRRVALHIGAARRLRATIGDDEPTAHAEAIFDPTGRLLHAAGPASSRSGRAALREGLVAMTRARGPLRARDGALALWHGLVAGRWSLVDHFDHDGKRFLVAIENAPGVDTPALRPRESAAVRLASEGNAPKEIAYALGISASNARALLATGLRKLGLRRRAELHRLDFDAGSLHELPVPGVRVAALPMRPARVPAPVRGSLTPAERAVCELLQRGATNREIARARGTSERTVAHQVETILRKLGVRSRADVARA